MITRYILFLFFFVKKYIYFLYNLNLFSFLFKSTSNYIARRYGVRAAMPGFIAKKLCPQLVIVPLNFAQYAAVSKEVRDVLVKYDKHFCPTSFDEAYLDITEHLNLRKTLPKEKRTVICRTCDRLDPHYCSCDPNKSDCESTTDNEDLNFVPDKETPSTDQLCFQEQNQSNLLQIEDPSLVKGQDIKMCPLCKREVPNYREEVFGVSPEEAVREIRRKIEQRTRLTASAGKQTNGSSFLKMALFDFIFLKSNLKMKKIVIIRSFHHFVNSHLFRMI